MKPWERYQQQPTAPPAAGPWSKYQQPAMPPLGTERVGATAEGRPIIKNPDGSHSTERSITGPWGPNGEWTNIPSMFGGRQLSEEEAVRIMRANNWVDPETGRRAEFYPDQQSAVTAAQQRSSGALGQYGGGAPPIPAPQSTGDIFREQLRAPLERAHPTRFPEHVEQAVREVVTEDIPQAASNALDASGTHYRTLAHGAGLPVDAPTERDAANYRNAVIDMLMTTGGGAAGRAIGQRVGDTAKYLGRGFRSIPGAERFLSREAPNVAADAAKHVNWRDLIDPALSAAATQAIFGPWDPTPWEFADQIAGGVASTGVAAGVAKNTIDDLLLSSPKWREMVMRPSSGNASALIGALLGHYGAQLVTPEAERAAPAARRTSVGADAIPPPKWGRRE